MYLRQYVMKALVLIVALGQLMAQQTPRLMTKLEVRVQREDVPSDSFAARPKVLYRAGNGYCRTEEMPDEVHGIHGLMIISEPDVWMVNLLSRTAQHLVDAGPTFNCRMPIFQEGKVGSATATKGAIAELEFGRELAYFRGKGAISKGGPLLKGRATNAYGVAVGDSQLLLFTAGTPERPWAVARKAGNAAEIFWYGTYEEMPFDAKLFEKPEGVKIEEAK